jgi:hypothetical protein
MSETPTAIAPDLLERRDFTMQLILAVLSSATIVVSEACGSSGSDPSPVGGGGNGGGGGGDGSVSGTISGNHGHVATITAAQLTAGNAVALDITGSASHSHSVSLSAQDILDVAARKTVAKASSTNSGHDHTVTFN